MTDQAPNRRSRRGRPRSADGMTRHNRIVTFVTDAELALLEQVAIDEERSMAAVVHRIIKRHFERQGNQHRGLHDEN